MKYFHNKRLTADNAMCILRRVHTSLAGMSQEEQKYALPNISSWHELLKQFLKLQIQLRVNIFDLLKNITTQSLKAKFMFVRGNNIYQIK